MSNILYIAEKANAGKDMGEALNITDRNKDGFLKGQIGDDKIVIAWVSGHLATLKEPVDYDKKYRKWNL